MDNDTYVKARYMTAGKMSLQGVGFVELDYSNSEMPEVDIAILEEYQGKGYGKQLIQYWENDMKRRGYEMLLTSTQVDEKAQHFYRKLGYKDCGGFVIDIPQYAQPMEMFFIKSI